MSRHAHVAVTLGMQPRAISILDVASLARSVQYRVEILGFTNAEWGGDLPLRPGVAGLRVRPPGPMSTSTSLVAP